MNRRQLFLVTAALVPGSGFASAQPWTASLLTGSFDGVKYDLAILLQLKPVWKTYWRVPGAGGIPPAIEVNGPNVKSFAFDCPLPQRLSGPEGENIGYHDAVGFPVTVVPVDPGRPVSATISLFAGVCETICIPAQFKADIRLDPAIRGSDQAAIQQWQIKVPQQTDIITQAQYDETSGHLTLVTTRQIGDVFMECTARPTIFNGPPTPDNVMAISGLRHGQSLAGQTCRFTLATAFGGLEQTLVVR